MSEQRGKDWQAFYEAAWEKKKRENNMLAAKLAEAETKQEELLCQWNRLHTNPAWKAAASLKRLCRGKGQGKAAEGAVCETAGAELPVYPVYEEECKRQREPYLQWIKENNMRDLKAETEGVYHDAIRVGEKEEIWEVEIPETDLLLYGYGKGYLDRRTFYEIKSYFNQHEACLMASVDEDFYWKDLQHRMCPWFKPCYSPDTLLAFNCYGHVVAVRRELAERTGVRELCSRQMQSGMTPAQGFYDLCLRLEENTRWDSLHVIPGVFEQETKIGCVQEVLLHKSYVLTEEKDAVCRQMQEGRFAYVQECLKEEQESGAYLTGAGAAYLQIRADALARRGIRAFLRAGQNPELFHVVYDTAISGRERCSRAQNSLNTDEIRFLVSVIIPTKDHTDILEKCLESFVTVTDYEDYEFVIVDNGSSPENRAYLEQELPKKLHALWEQTGRERELQYSYLYQEMPFNFSRMCNLGAERAQGDLLLFLNDDMEIIEESWLERMVGQALQPYVGAVGAKLWYAGTMKIQHTGITNLDIGPSHKLITFEDDRDYYYGHNQLTYDMAGVTGACLLVSRAKYREAGGMDETMAVAYNDVDLCFRLMECGYYNVLRNDAVLFHHESLSRGLDEEDQDKWKRLLLEKERLYEKHPRLKSYDPFYSPHLIDNASDYRCCYKFPYEEQLTVVKPARLEEKELGRLRKVKQGELRLTIDRGEMQHKIHASEPDILWVMGWSYLHGADNAAYERVLLLQREDLLTYTVPLQPWHRVDVEQILPQELHVELAGFTARILREDLESGNYRMGMLCTDRRKGSKQTRFLAWSEAQLPVLGKQ